MSVAEVCSHEIVCVEDSVARVSGEKRVQQMSAVAGDGGEQSLISISTDAVKRRLNISFSVYHSVLRHSVDSVIINQIDIRTTKFLETYLMSENHICQLFSNRTQCALTDIFLSYDITRQLSFGMLFSTHFWVTYLNSIILVFLSLEMR